MLQPYSLVLLQIQYKSSHTGSCWGKTEQEKEGRFQVIFSTVHNVFCSEAWVSVTGELTVLCSCWEYFFLIMAIHQLLPFTPLPPIAHSQPHCLFTFLVLFLSLISPFSELIVLTKLTEDYSMLSLRHGRVMYLGQERAKRMNKGRSKTRN